MRGYTVEGSRVFSPVVFVFLSQDRHKLNTQALVPSTSYHPLFFLVEFLLRSPGYYIRDQMIPSGPVYLFLFLFNLYLRQLQDCHCTICSGGIRFYPFVLHYPHP
jgi:hypothetical protein